MGTYILCHFEVQNEFYNNLNLLIAVEDVRSQPPPPLPPPLRMANIYGDHMVLQQAPARASIWGYVTKCDSKLTTTFNGLKYTPRTFTGIIIMYVRMYNRSPSF